MITFTVPTVPVPVSAYGDTLLHEFPRAAITVLPWMAAVTVFVIGVGLIRRWLGARTAFMEESSKMRAATRWADRLLRQGRRSRSSLSPRRQAVYK